MDTMVARLGGPSALGLVPNSEMDMARAICRGLPSQVLEHVLETGDLTRNEAYRVIGSRSSIMPRLQGRRPLTVDQSDRVVRVISTIMLAERVLGDHATARHWLREANAELRGWRPLDLLRLHIGAVIVRRELYRLESKNFGAMPEQGF
jgi:putative toxin-antitoxin system antitoxin component (TIGR02293 family)